MLLPVLNILGCTQLFCMSTVPADGLKIHWPGYDTVSGFARNGHLAIIEKLVAHVHGLPFEMS